MEMVCGDIQIYYEEAGHGKPLLLLHGNGESHEYFKNQIHYFARNYHVYALDTRGHGRSSRGKKKLDFDTLAEDVYLFLQKMHLGAVYIVGFSDGANIALTLALHHPACVERLVLNAGNLDPTGLKIHTRLAIYGAYLWLFVIALLSEPGRVKKEIWGLMVFHPHIAEVQLRKLTMPVLVLVGERDLIATHHNRRLVQMIPNVIYREIKGADHFGARSHAREYNRYIAEFLRGNYNHRRT